MTDPPFVRPRRSGALCVLGALPSPARRQDSAFHLATTDPARAPSPFIGNGRIGVVIPALGIGASNSFMAGIYEHAPGDVPRIVGRARRGTRSPIFDGDAVARQHGRRRAPPGLPPGDRHADRHRTHQLRLGERHPSHDGTRSRPSSPGPTPTSPRSGCTLTPPLRGPAAGPVRDRRPAAAPPPSARHGAARRPELGPGGHLVSGPHRWCAPAPRAGLRHGARLSAHRHARGAHDRAGPGGGVAWPADLARARGPHHGASGDTAAVELAFDAAAGPDLHLTHVVGFDTSGTDPRAPARASREAEAASARGWDALAADNAARLATPMGNRHRDRRRLRPPAGGPVHALLSPRERRPRGPPWASRRWDSPAAGTTATSSGTPTPGCSRSLLVTHPDMAHSLVAFRRRTLDAARANARANGFQRRDVSLGGRRARGRDHAALRGPERQDGDPRQRRRGPGAVAVLPGHRRLGLAGSRRLSRHSRDGQLLGEPCPARLRREAATTSTAWSRCTRGSSA